MNERENSCFETKFPFTTEIAIQPRLTEEIETVLHLVGSDR